MESPKSNQIGLIKVVLWSIIGCSAMALVYHIRWMLAYLIFGYHYVVPEVQTPEIWFAVQIFSNAIFIFIGMKFLQLIKKYQELGYFDSSSLKVFDLVIYACLVLAVLGSVQMMVANSKEMHLQSWTSFTAIVNLLFRSIVKLLILDGPQSMYLLLAILIWSVKKFAVKALLVKKENEEFI